MKQANVVRLLQPQQPAAVEEVSKLPKGVTFKGNTYWSTKQIAELFNTCTGDIHSVRALNKKEFIEGVDTIAVVGRKEYVKMFGKYKTGSNVRLWSVTGVLKVARLSENDTVLIPIAEKLAKEYSTRGTQMQQPTAAVEGGSKEELIKTVKQLPKGTAIQNNFKINCEIADQLDAMAQQLGLRKSDLVAVALLDFFDYYAEAMTPQPIHSQLELEEAIAAGVREAMRNLKGL